MQRTELCCPRCRRLIVRRPSTKKLFGLFAVETLGSACEACGARLLYTPDGSEVSMAAEQDPASEN